MSSRACRRGRSRIPAARRSRRSPIPSRTKDLYFVADGTGGHAFAETLEQHNRNVVRWRQIERAKAAGEAAPVDRLEPPPETRTDGVPVGQAPATRASAFTATPGAQPLPAAGGTRPPGPGDGRARGFDAHRRHAP
jgi:UPF0755 protein